MVTVELSVSAMICTHNRAEYLGNAIDSLLAQNFDSFEVVDHASSDRTYEVVEARLRNPHLKDGYESQIGLSVARNTGEKVTSGEISAYLDDDAIASPHWLRTLSDTDEQNPQLAIAGRKAALVTGILDIFGRHCKR